MGLTRNEAKLTRQAFLDMAGDTDKLNMTLKTLESARAKGAPWLQDAAKYAAAVQRVRNDLDPEVIRKTAAAAKAKAEVDATAAKITAALRSETDDYSDSLAMYY